MAQGKGCHLLSSTCKDGIESYHRVGGKSTQDLFSSKMSFHLRMKMYFQLDQGRRGTKPVTWPINPGASLAASGVVNTPGKKTSLGKNSATQMTNNRDAGLQK